MYPQYKAHRREHPPGLAEAVCRILAVVDALGIPVLSVPGVEADDVVGTLALKAQQDGFGSVVIVSTDKVSSSTSGAVCCMQGTPTPVPAWLLRCLGHCRAVCMLVWSCASSIAEQAQWVCLHLLRRPKF